jgi:predicted ATPase/DNA-binding winged helix-turn-helix (wHTH) protein
MHCWFLDCDLDESRRHLKRAGQPVTLEPQAFDLLVYLVRQRDRVVPKDELLQVLWHGAVVSDAALSQCIMRARRAIGDADPARRVIQTFPRRGFRFVAAVQTHKSPAAGSNERPPADNGRLPVDLHGGQFAFGGRGTEIDALLAAWRQAVAGTRQVVLVAGEPGIGKTRLAVEFSHGVHAEAASVLFGRCDEEVGTPFQPFVEALRQFVDACPAEQLPERLGRYLGELVCLRPELAQRVPGIAPTPVSDAETARYRLFEAVTEWFAAMCHTGPVLLVVDDLHWASRETALLLRHVVRSTQRARLLIIVTYRDTDLPRHHPVLRVIDDIQSDATVQRLHLRGLEIDAVHAFLATAAAESNPADLTLARAVHARSEGNPLFAAELVRHLRASEMLCREGTGSLASLGVPGRVRSVIGRRLSRLSEAAQQALALASVVGREFPSAVLANVVGLGEDQLLPLLAEAIAARLVEETGPETYRFTHALVRDALYDELGATRRVRLHRQVRETIESGHRVQVETQSVRPPTPGHPRKM